MKGTKGTVAVRMDSYAPSTNLGQLYVEASLAWLVMEGGIPQCRDFRFPSAGLRTGFTPLRCVQNDGRGVRRNCDWVLPQFIRQRYHARPRYRLRLAPDLPSAKMRDQDVVVLVGCGWPPISHRLKCRAGSATDPSRCGWPPISHRLKYNRPGYAVSLCCGWPPISHRLKSNVQLFQSIMVAVGPRSPIG